MVKITHTDHIKQTTTVIECENINTLKEIGLIRITPKMSASAEAHYFGKMRFKRDIIDCLTHSECLDCRQYLACHGYEE